MTDKQIPMQPNDTESQGKGQLKSYPAGWRHIVTMISFVGFVCMYNMRINVGVALVAMLNHTALADLQHQGANATHRRQSICNSTKNSTDHSGDGPYIWSNEVQGIILSSFFYGYILTQFAGGLLANRYGAKWVFGLGNFSQAVFTMLGPLAARMGVGVFIFTRVMQGVSSGVTWPSMQAFFSRWAPISERSTLPAIAYAGSFLGTPFTFLLSGILASSGFMGGWPAIFYVFAGLIYTGICINGKNIDELVYQISANSQYEHTRPCSDRARRDLPNSSWYHLWISCNYQCRGVQTFHKVKTANAIMTMVWFAFWVFLSSSGPEDHRFISEGERAYILQSSQAGAKKPGVMDVPWRQVLASSAVWAVVVSHFTNNWGLYTLMTTLPTYFKKVQGFNIKENGFVSALPYLVQFIFHVGSGRVADFLRVKFNLKTVHVRKLFDCLGHLLPALAIIALGFVGCNGRAAVALLILTVGCTGFCGAGWYVNFLDLAPQYAGILFGVSNTFSTIPGIVGPYLANVLTKENTVGNWRIVFFIIATLYMFSAVFYAIFGEGHIQSWADGSLANDLKQRAATTTTTTGSASTNSRKTPASASGPSRNSTTKT